MSWNQNDVVSKYNENTTSNEVQRRLVNSHDETHTKNRVVRTTETSQIDQELIVEFLGQLNLNIVGVSEKTMRLIIMVDLRY